MDHQELIGRSLRFTYSDETYLIEVLNEAQIKWTRTVGASVGQGDTEAYVYSKLSASIGVITWIEADGLGLSNALNFAEKSVTTHANMGREVFENRGDLEVFQT